MKALPAGLRNYLARFGSRRTVLPDLRAGLVLGVESVPDGLAAGMLAGLNPLHGLYAYLVGTLGGSLATGSVFMSVQATGAMAVVVADVSGSTPGGLTPAGLAMLGIMAGLIMLALGLARLGSLVRFIPTAVLVGFVNAVAINIVLGQLDNATGSQAEGANRVLRAVDSFLNIAHWSLPTVLVSAVTLALILLLERTRLGALAMVAAVAVGSALAVALGLFPGLDPVAKISDLTSVPSALPGFVAPDLTQLWSLIVPACSLALVGLVQGAAISGSVPNPNGRYGDASADFRGQGIANIASGFLQGMPVGGSMSATALVRAAGAKSALANLSAAVVMALTILLAAPLIGLVAMPALAALLILIGVRTFKLHQVLLVWKTGPIQATVLAVTFVLTLLIPLQYAALTGVGLAVILFVVRQSNRVVLKHWVFDDERPLPREVPAPETLPVGETVVLVPYGSLFFAAAPVIERQLPGVPAAAHGTAVVFRLRGKDQIGSTFLRVLETYSTALRAAGGTLILAGVSDSVNGQLRATGALDRLGAAHVFPEYERLGDSVTRAREFAAEWRAAQAESPPTA
ncbi:SulP family inorganic anion transporter [Leucobacter luti]|uniref:SulP family sulfate permease n=1 Tax=Leucobacter luti TaxID=340320 RepID=A0A4Q7U3S6_9MICO|nr:SulP family inorganic anion transporter [Leucobacter luti]MBL3700772.1 SulP family inorganic anion transporter [Leucobacter luti]RZT68391.1 SulP family sulfate permease [Leucobacter luti]